MGSKSNTPISTRSSRWTVPDSLIQEKDFEGSVDNSAILGSIVEDKVDGHDHMENWLRAVHAALTSLKEENNFDDMLEDSGNALRSPLRGTVADASVSAHIL